MMMRYEVFCPDRPSFVSEFHNSEEIANHRAYILGEFYKNEGMTFLVQKTISTEGFPATLEPPTNHPYVYPITLVKNELYEDLRKKFGVQHQLLIAMEECSELIKAISKMQRLMMSAKEAKIWNYSSSNTPEVLQIAEEIADVQIVSEQLMLQFNIEKQVEDFKHEKLLRIKEKILK